MAASYPASRWITFLRKYGPVPSNDNMYDEAIQRSLRRIDMRPIELPSAYLERIIENLENSPPRSVLLTGTAGDGKTFHCREVYRHFGGDLDTWHEARTTVQRIQVGDYELQVVKDLSEFPGDDGRTFTRVMADDIADPSTKRIFLVAANHGQLLEKLNQASEAPRVAALREQIVEAMVTGQNADDSFLAVFDLSKVSGTELLQQITAAILNHPGWNACSECSLYTQTPRCPIQENRSRLASEKEPTLQQRLTALIELSELNDVHYPIRQLLALTANMLLGHPTATDGLMTCQTAARILADGNHDGASVYSNVFGDNLKRRANKSEPFTKLRSFGIGEETNNSIDSILVYGNDDPALKDRFAELLLDDPVYGATPGYTTAQTAYLEGAEGGRATTFLDYLKHARHRLFFSIAPGSAMETLLWDLTVFRFAGEFLETSRQLQDGRSATRHVMRQIVKGLNCVFTGMLIEDEQQIVVASAGSHSQSRTSHIVDAFVSVAPRLGEEVHLGWNAGRVVLSISVAPPTDIEAVVLPLTLLRFEFLCRVAGGALPSSFSRECYEDFLDYKARLFRALQERDSGNHPSLVDEVVINFLDVGPDGRARQEPVSVKVR